MKETNQPLYMEHFKEVTHFMMNGVLEIIKHPDGSSEIVYANEAAGRLLFSGPADTTQKLNYDPYASVYPADKERVKEAIESCRVNEQVKETYRVYDKNGEIIWVLAHFNSRQVGDDIHIVIIYSNISELMGTQTKLQSEGDKLLDIVNSIPMGLAIFEIDHEGKSVVLSLNDQMVSFANYIGSLLDGNQRKWTKEELTMLFNQSIYSFCENSDIPLVEKMIEDSKTKEISNCIFRLRGSTETKPIFVKSTCFSKDVSERSRNYYITFENVTKDKLQEIELVNKQKMLIEYSYFDALTHAKNRHSFNELVRSCRITPLQNVGIMFADLNGLKTVNDMLGHQYGDEMIARFVNILKKHFDLDVIYRISGDEFLVICQNIERSEFNERMSHILKDSNENDNIASIGYVWEETVGDIKFTLHRAEQIMYVEKQKYYEIEKSMKSKHRPLLLTSLLSDLENNRFKLYLQPKADVSTSRVNGAEALVRKLDENGKVVPPFEFIPQLEKERLIPKIDFFMLEEVCKYLETHKNQTDIIISVNMSRVTLVENDYIETIEEIIGRYDFDISRLEFEITESNETMDLQRLEEYIKKIKSLGIRISLDDVGTDYSSLPLLVLDGIDCVKLDRSLIIQIDNPKANTLLRHVINMCHDLKLEVIAEGIETDAALESLRKLECDSYQGFLLSKPISAEDFTDKYL